MYFHRPFRKYWGLRIGICDKVYTVYSVLSCFWCSNWRCSLQLRGRFIILEPGTHMEDSKLIFTINVLFLCIYFIIYTFYKYLFYEKLPSVKKADGHFKVGATLK